MKRVLTGLAILTLLLGAARPAWAAMMLTGAGTAEGFTLSTFATNFPTSGGVGPMGIAFPTSGGVLVSDGAEHVRLFPTDGDGQNAASFAAVAIDNGGMAKAGGLIYEGQFHN